MTNKFYTPEQVKSIIYYEFAMEAHSEQVAEIKNEMALYKYELELPAPPAEPPGFDQFWNIFYVIDTDRALSETLYSGQSKYTGHDAFHDMVRDTMIALTVDEAEAVLERIERSRQAHEAEAARWAAERENDNCPF